MVLYVLFPFKSVKTVKVVIRPPTGIHAFKPMNDSLPYIASYCLRLIVFEHDYTGNLLMLRAA